MKKWWSFKYISRHKNEYWFEKNSTGWCGKTKKNIGAVVKPNWKELKNPDLLVLLWSKAKFELTCNTNAANEDADLINFFKKTA